ncbi:ArsI/CadI family heavy metal resistance metalloenzyme [Nocardia sp. CNY236]|uniref:ArsI/CadI family heavy metal resistance metalloenzyme n=1 Tax=Nocardia sp. CNY236 TaxID=1169152 RepID=UPI000491AA18|nr:ArsI/CadI family heavy metal resistance metalloenzyme [Nocardia sp. CNY236]
MSRIQLALHVDDLEQAVRFYSTLFRVEPAKHESGYARLVVADPPVKLELLENPGRGGNVDHLGIEVETSEQVHAESARLSAAGLAAEEQVATTCCFATQDKVWVTAPDRERWGVHTVIGDSETCCAVSGLGSDEQSSACCDSADSAGPDCCSPDEQRAVSAAGASCCG